jgi:hypothetical protein
MKKIFLVICAILIFATSQALNDSVFVSVSTRKMNILYVGIENPISIGVSNLCGQQPEIKINKGHIKYEGNGNYSVLVDSVGETKISISYILDGATYTQERFFRNKTVPNPVITLFNRHCGEKVNKNVILAQEYLKAQLENFDFDAQFKVISFDVSSTKNAQLVPSDTEKFSLQQREFIRKLKVGDALLIKNTKVMAPDKIVRTLDDCIFYID